MAGIRHSLVFSFAEKYSTLLINIVATVILARLLTPAETGIYSVAAGIINVAQTMRDFGVGNYIIQETELTRQRLSTSLGISIALGVAVALFFVAAAGPLATLFHEPRLKTVVLIMSLNFILVAFAAIGTARLHRDMNFRAALRIGIAATAMHAATSVIMASNGYGAVGMAWASVMGVSVYLVGNYICYAEDILLAPRLSEWRRVLGFGVLASGGYVLQEMGQRVADVVVGRFLGFSAAGMYSRAGGLVSLFQQSLMNAVAPVALGALALINRRDEDIKAPFLRFLNYTTIVAWPVLGVMALLAAPIILVAFGPQWSAAVDSARILCLAAAVAVLSRVAITLFTATGAVRRLFQVQMIAIPILVGAVSLGANFSIEAAAAGMTIGSLAHAIYALYQVNRAIATNWRQIGAALGTSLMVTVLALILPVGILLYFGLTPENFWPQTLLTGFTAVVSWLAGIFALRHPIADEILMAIRHLSPSRHRPRLFPIESLLTPNLGHRPILTVVVDAEEEFAWNKSFDAGATSVLNIASVPLAQEVLDRYGAVPTYVVDYPVATSPTARAILGEIARSNRCEIGAHLHPWVNPPHDCPVDVAHSFPGNLPPELERNKLKMLTSAITAGFGRPPFIYKAGRYGVGPATVDILADLGYQMDVSVVPHTDFSCFRGPDFTNFSTAPFRTSRGITVLPLSVGFVGALANMGATLYPILASRIGMMFRLPSLASRLRLIERIRLSPEGHSLQDLIKLTRASLRRGQRVFMLTYHSASLLPGATPYVRSEADRQQFLSTLAGYLEFFCRDCGGHPESLSMVMASLVAPLPSIPIGPAVPIGVTAFEREQA